MTRHVRNLWAQYMWFQRESIHFRIPNSKNRKLKRKIKPFVRASFFIVKVESFEKVFRKMFEAFYSLAEGAVSFVTLVWEFHLAGAKFFGKVMQLTFKAIESEWETIKILVLMWCPLVSLSLVYYKSF